MGYDLNYWKYKEGVTLPVGKVYQTACCEGEPVEGLEPLPIDAILTEIAAAFPGWERLDAATWREKTGSSFQLFTTPQILRADCYGLTQEEMIQLSRIMGSCGCPLYDPQLGVRFDTLSLWLYGEAADIRGAVEEEAARLFPELEPGATHCEPVPSGAVPLPRPEHPVLELFVHRGKKSVKITANLYFGSGWTSRPTQCKIALLTDPETTREQLSKLACTVMERAAEDMRQRTFY